MGVLSLVAKAWRVGLLRTAGMVARYAVQVALNPRIQAASFVQLQPRARLVVPKGASLRIGKGVVIKNDGVILVNPGARLTLDDHFSLGHHGEITVGGTIAIGDYTTMGPCTYLTDCNHRFEPTNVPIICQPMEVKPTSIGRDVWMGRGSMVLPGAVVPDGCVVAAGAIVTRAHQPGDVIAGTPGRTVRNRFE